MHDFLIHHLTDRAERYLSFNVRRSMFDVGRSNLRTPALCSLWLIKTAKQQQKFPLVPDFPNSYHISTMSRKNSTLDIEYVDTPERRIVSLEKDGIACIPVLAYNHLSNSRPGVTLHSHQSIFECCYCLRGSLSFEYENGFRHLLPGDVTVNQPGEKHRLSSKPKSMVMYTLFLRLGGKNDTILNLSTDESEALRRKLFKTPHNILKGDTRLRSAFQRLFKLYDELKPGPFRRLALRNAALDLILILIELPTKETGKKRSDRVAALIETIRSQPEEDYTIDQMMRATALSESQLATQFKQQVGLPPYTFLLSCRIHAAKKHLRHSDHSITEIAHALGFSSSQHLAMQFKREFGISPSAFRAGKAPLI